MSAPSVHRARPDGHAGPGRRRRSFEGELRRGGHGRRRARSCSTPRSPATRRSLTDPSYAGQIITFTYPHIGNYGVNADDDESRQPFCRGVIVRDLARRAEQLARDRRSRRVPRRRTGSPGSPGIDTRRLTRHLRDTGARPRRVRGRRGRGPRRGRHGPCATDGHRPRRRGDDRRAVRRRRRPTRRSASSRTTSGSSARSCATSSRAGCRVEVVPASTTRRRRAGPRARRRVPLERSRRPRGSRAVRPTRCAALRRRGAGVRHLPRPPDPRPRARAAERRKLLLRPPRREPPGAPRGDRPRRDHQPEPQLRRCSADTVPGGAELTHVNLNDGDRRGLAAPRRPGVQRAAPPRGRARAPRRRVPVRGVHRPDGRPRLDADPRPRGVLTACRSAPTSTRSSSSAADRSSSARRASSTTRAPRRAGCSRREGYRVVLVNSNPATIMTDPEFADATYVEPLDVDDADPRSSSASGPTRCFRRSAGRPR